jgi:hypothetical protein
MDGPFNWVGDQDGCSGPASPLEAMGYRITGSRGDALARSIHKVHAKQLFARAGIPTPRWRLCRTVSEVRRSVADCQAGSRRWQSRYRRRRLFAIRRLAARGIRSSATGRPRWEEFIIGRVQRLCDTEVLPLAQIDFRLLRTFL